MSSREKGAILRAWAKREGGTNWQSLTLTLKNWRIPEQGGKTTGLVNDVGIHTFWTQNLGSYMEY